MNRQELSLQLAVVALVRNEIDIIRAFLSHVAALFDRAVLLDHGSMDGTGAMLEGACRLRPGWVRWRVDVPGHHQAVFSAFAMRHLFETTDTDMVFFLDADEFLDVPDRAALERALAGIEGERTAGRFDWVDCIPERLDSRTLRAGDAVWAHAGDAPFSKIVVPRRFYAATGGALVPSSGNHSVVPNDNGPVCYHRLGGMLHLPLRSVAQLQRKIIIGALGVLARSDNASHESAHWFDMLRRLAVADIGESDLINMARCYGHKPDSWPPLSLADLPALGFSRRTLDVASQALALPDLPPPANPWRVIAAAVRDWRAGYDRDIALVLTGDVLSRAPQPGPPAPSAADAPARAPWEATLAALESSLAEARADQARAHEDVRIVRASTSYRVTAPLRAAARAWRRQRATEPAVRPLADITVVVTSCGRHDLLAQTLASFRRYNTDPKVGDILVVEDGGADPQAICDAHGARLLRTGTRVGQVAAIDLAYAHVQTELVFHLEDDWEFYRPGFIEPSRAILLADPSCIVVGLRAWNDLNDHPLSFTAADRRFGVLATGFRKIWHGFTWNPGLRRMADYRRLGRYGDHVEAPADVPGQDRGGAEAGIGAIYHALGYRGVVLDEHGYVRHLGWGRTVPWTGNAQTRQPSLDQIQPASL